MRSIFSMGTALMMMTAFAVAGEEGSDTATAVGMACYGDADAALCKDVAEHLHERLQLQTLETVQVPAAGSNDLETVATLLAEDRPENTYCVVGLIAATSEPDKHGVVYPKAKVGLVNLAALQAGAGEDPAVLLRRAKKETVRVVLLLSGLKPCLNPRCVLRHNVDFEQLDVKALGPCPPCLIKFLAWGREKGVVASGTP